MEKKLNKILEKIENEILNIKNEELNNSKELEMLKNIIDKNNLYDIEETDFISISDLLLCAVIIENKYNDFNEVINLYEKNKQKIDKLLPKDLALFAILINKIRSEFKDVNVIIDSLEEHVEICFKGESSDSILSSEFMSDENNIELIEMLKLFVLSNVSIIEYLADIKEMNEKKETLRQVYYKAKKDFLPMIPELNTKELNKKALRSFFNINEINKTLSKIINYYKKIYKENKKDLSITKDKIKSLYSLKQLLIDSSNYQEIKNIKYISNLCTDNLRKDVLMFIAQKNQKYYLELEQEYNYSKQNSVINYINLFEKKEIDFKMFTKEEQQKILEVKLEVVEKILNFLQYIDFNFNNSILKIITNTNLNIINNLENYIKKGILNKEFIRKNINILLNTNETNSLYNKLINNMSIFLDNDINIIGVDNLDIFLGDTLLIKENIEFVDRLGINIKTRNLKNYIFLLDVALEQKVSELIKLGVDINKNIDILNSDINIVKRIKLCLVLNINIYENDKIREEILDKNEFFIPDSKINEYVDKITIVKK